MVTGNARAIRLSAAASMIACVVALMLALCGCSSGGADVEGGAGMDAEAQATARDQDGSTEESAGALLEQGEAGAESNSARDAAESEERRVSVTVGGASFAAVLDSGSAAEELASRMPFECEMSDLNAYEKFAYLAEPLLTDASQPGQINAGDIMLYGDDCLVVFYESFQSPYSYTRIGRIEDASGLAEALGSGSATVSFSEGRR